MDNSADALIARMKELQLKGVQHSEAFERARLEQRIRSSPEAWGNHLEVLLYGGIEIESDVEVQNWPFY